ncbi:hypothetical protein D3C79_910670 [compost metagenome]
MTVFRAALGQNDVVIAILLQQVRAFGRRFTGSRPEEQRLVDGCGQLLVQPLQPCPTAAEYHIGRPVVIDE